MNRQIHSRLWNRFWNKLWLLDTDLTQGICFAGFPCHMCFCKTKVFSICAIIIFIALLILKIKVKQVFVPYIPYYSPHWNIRHIVNERSILKLCKLKNLENTQTCLQLVKEEKKKQPLDRALCLKTLAWSSSHTHSVKFRNKFLDRRQAAKERWPTQICHVNHVQCERSFRHTAIYWKSKIRLLAF